MYTFKQENKYQEIPEHNDGQDFPEISWMNLPKKEKFKKNNKEFDSKSKDKKYKRDYSKEREQKRGY